MFRRIVDALPSITPVILSEALSSGSSEHRLSRAQRPSQEYSLLPVPLSAHHQVPQRLKGSPAQSVLDDAQLCNLGPQAGMIAFAGGRSGWPLEQRGTQVQSTSGAPIHDVGIVALRKLILQALAACHKFG